MPHVRWRTASQRLNSAGRFRIRHFYRIQRATVLFILLLLRRFCAAFYLLGRTACRWFGCGISSPPAGTVKTGDLLPAHHPTPSLPYSALPTATYHRLLCYFPVKT